LVYFFGGTPLAILLVAKLRSLEHHQFFPCRKKLVEVGGIEPPSLSNPIKAATCLVYSLRLILKTSINRIFQDAAFFGLVLIPKANNQDQPKLFAQFYPLGRAD